jgi:hypothetical protein
MTGGLPQHLLRGSGFVQLKFNAQKPIYVWNRGGSQCC